MSGLLMELAVETVMTVHVADARLINPRVLGLALDSGPNLQIYRNIEASKQC